MSIIFFFNLQKKCQSTLKTIVVEKLLNFEAKKQMGQN